MSYATMLDDSNTVITSISVDDDIENPVEWCTNRYGGVWIAGVASAGDSYDPKTDEFIPLQSLIPLIPPGTPIIVK